MFFSFLVHSSELISGVLLIIFGSIGTQFLLFLAFRLLILEKLVHSSSYFWSSVYYFWANHYTKFLTKCFQLNIFGPASIFGIPLGLKKEQRKEDRAVMMIQQSSLLLSESEAESRQVLYFCRLHSAMQGGRKGGPGGPRPPQLFGCANKKTLFPLNKE